MTWGDSQMTLDRPTDRPTEVDFILQGDCLETLKTLPDKSVNCSVTSPPYFGLRDYGVDGQIGLEETPEEYIERLVDVFREVKRVLRDDGTLWLNIGDSYNSQPPGNKKPSGFSQTRPSRLSGNGDQETVKTGRHLIKGIKQKDLIGIPWMLAFALRADGWYLRQDIIWHKPNPMPESVKDRCTKSHEYIFMLSKSQQYYFDSDAIQEEAVSVINENSNLRFGGKKYGDNNDKHFQTYSGNTYKPRTKNVMAKGLTPNGMHLRREEGEQDVQYTVRNKRDVWTIPVQPTKEAHFATFPEKLVEPCILAGCPVGGVVLDPFFGSGTTGRVAISTNRHYIGCELNPEYIEICNRRTNNVQLTFTGLI